MHHNPSQHISRRLFILAVRRARTQVVCLGRSRIGNQITTSLLHLGSPLHLFSVSGDVGSPDDLAVVAAGRGHEDVEPLGQDEARTDDEDGNVRNTEAHDVERVVAQLVKVGVREAKHDSQRGRSNVAD